MIEHPHKEAMRRAVIKLLQQQRERLDSEVTSAAESTVSTLSLLAQLYIRSLASAAKHFAELAGRATANALDVAQSLEDSHVSFDDLLSFAQDTVDVDAQPSTSSAQDLAAGIEDPIFYEYVDIPEDYNFVEPILTPENLDDLELEPLSEAMIFPSQTPQDLLVNRIPKPTISEFAPEGSGKVQPAAPLESDEAKPAETSPVINVPTIEVVSKPTPVEGLQSWRSLLNRRQSLLQSEATKSTRPLYAEHDELYRSSYLSLKNRVPDLVSPGDQGPFEVGAFAPEPPSGNKATVNHTLTPYETPITPLFYNSVLSSFLPKLVTSAPQPLQPEEHEQLGQAPLPSWANVPIVVEEPKPVVRIVAKVATPPKPPATIIKIKPPKKEKELRETPVKRKPKPKPVDRPSFKPKSLGKAPKPYGASWKPSNPKSHYAKTNKLMLANFVPSLRKLETPKLTNQSRDVPERSTSSNEGLTSASPDTQPELPNGNQEWPTETCVNGMPKITLKFKVPSPKKATPKVVLRIPSSADFVDQRPPQNLKRGYDELTSGAINCFCSDYGLDHGTMMVSCDGCEQWFHGECVGILTKDKLPDSWFCERCIHRGEKPRAHHKRSKHHHSAADQDDFYDHQIIEDGPEW